MSVPMLVFFNKGLDIVFVHKHFLPDPHAWELGIPNHASPEPFGAADFGCQFFYRVKPLREHGRVRFFCFHPTSNRNTLFCIS